MRRPPRAALIALAVAALVLIVAPDAFAAAGGGSAGFGGGGGGGGEGGGGGGGSGAGLFILIQILIRIAVLGHGVGALVLIGLFLVWFVVTRGAPRAGRFWAARGSQGPSARRRTAQRQRQVELAAAEAAEEDPAFAPDIVKPAAARLYTDIQAAWDSGNRARLSQLVAPDLLAEWERRLDDFDRRGWHNRVQPLGDPSIDYVGLVNRGSHDRDRVTVRVDARLRDYVEDRYGRRIKRAGRLSETVRVREFWTLAKDDRGRWMLASIEQGAEGMHVLNERVVTTPWSDDQKLRDDALIEGAMQDAVPEHTKIAELADLDFEGDARSAALDLSVADGRFAPDVLEVAARRAVEAWAEAVDGDDAALNQIARPAAARELLHPGDPSAQTRLVVRGPRVNQIRITALDAEATPPTMTIEVDLKGRRYIEDRNTTGVLGGSQSRETNFTEHWMLALEGDASMPWRIAAVGAPVARA